MLGPIIVTIDGSGFNAPSARELETDPEARDQVEAIGRAVSVVFFGNDAHTHHVEIRLVH